MSKQLSRSLEQARTSFCILLVGLSIARCAVPARHQLCTPEEAVKAEQEACCLRTWQAVFESYQRYNHCDDAAISEGYSSSVAMMLADHWDQLDDLQKYFKGNVEFGRFILRHIDETMSPEQEHAIHQNVTELCPSQAREMCGQIRKQLEEFEKP